MADEPANEGAQGDESSADIDNHDLDAIVGGGVAPSQIDLELDVTSTTHVV